MSNLIYLILPLMLYVARTQVVDKFHAERYNRLLERTVTSLFTSLLLVGSLTKKLLLR